MLAGMPVHVVHRGNNRSACFFGEEDRSFYLLHLGRLAKPAGCLLHAYCLMTNHVHLLMTPLHLTSCALFMQRLGQLHSQYVNRAYRRSGSLWEGRFRSCLVQSQEYLLACYRYIELNPVRAGMVRHPGDYRWSSYRTNAGPSGGDPIVPHEEYVRLGESPEERRKAYRALFGSLAESPFTEEIRKATNGNYVLGDASFRAAMAAMLGRRVERAHAGRPVGTGAQPGAQPELTGLPEKSWSVPD